MEQKKNEQKTAQILYISIIMVLLVMAVVVGLVTAANKRNESPLQSGTSQVSGATTARTSATTISCTTSGSTTRATSRTTSRTTAATTTPANTTGRTTKQAVEVEAPISSLPKFIMPTIGNVSKTFSIDALVYSNTMEDYRTHNGIDICANLGEGVMAAADGIVTEVFAHPLMGNTVVISHDGNAQTVYQNLADDIPVAVGDTVNSGEIIGAVGDSAIIEIAEEAHLHFEMQIDGECVNPLEFIAAETMTVVYDEN